MIGIRVDGNAEIGTGHYMRCLAVARKLDEMGAHPVFFTIDCADAARADGFKAVELPGSYGGLSGEDILPILKKHKVRTLLVDSYFARPEYFERLYGMVGTAAFFDMGDSNFHCGLIVDYNINHSDFSFPNAKQLLLGPRYAPLRREFEDLGEPVLNAEAKSLILTTGGTDEAGATLKLMRALLGAPELSGIRMNVVIGRLNRWADEIVRLAGEIGVGRVVCHHNPANMAGLMRASDFAVSAGGSTLYEICACGLPCAAFSIAENQDRMINVMAESGAMLSCGVYREDEDACVRAVAENSIALARDAGLRRSLSGRAGALVDGRGAARVARALLEIK